jgi:hypothetical protein
MGRCAVIESGPNLFSQQWGPLDRTPGEGGETITQWRQFALLARALLRCAAALAQDQPGRDEDWRLVGYWLKRPEAQLATGRRQTHIVLQMRRMLLVQAVNRWYARSRRNGILLFSGDEIVICPSSNTLLGIIGVQLAYQIAHAEQMEICFHCKQWFVLSRVPSNGGRRFCERCRKEGKPQMYAARDYRQRTKLSERA